MHARFLAIAVLAGFLFLAPVGVWAQQDEKDALIEQQKKQIDNLKKNAEIYQKQIELQEKLSKALEETHKKEIEPWEKLTKARAERFRQEIETLQKTIKDREGSIVGLDADLKKLRVEAVQFEALARAVKTQNEKLLEQILVLTVRIARLEKSEGPELMAIRNPSEPNPPPAKVNGKIEKLEGDLMQIDLGTENGVLKNPTLEVYRLQPEPKYLGMIRVVDANAQQSVARQIPIGKAELRPMLKVGDLVTSKLTSEETKKEKDGAKKK